VKVFADWHHPALYESLALVFEDRFGWELYSPIGTEWIDQRVWRFSNTPIAYRMEDFLVFPDAVNAGDHYLLTEREYPERPRKLVTYAQARAMEWDVVIATVVPHQHSFAEFAKEVGAQFVYQVGNAFHPIDWEVEGMVVLASANIPILGRGTVYHQEFSRDLFRYEPPAQTATHKVTSFLMRLGWSCKPNWFAEQPDVEFKVLGGGSPRDPMYLTPMSAVAAEYRACGWAWHDKWMGDGYGHAIHNAIACGRPIIGHSEHYRGMLAERLWVDGVTCIDLSAHTEDEALRLWRRFANNPDQHQWLSEETALHFDRVVDFDADAEKIWRLLGG
jgi:hypothetical protein